MSVSRAGRLFLAWRAAERRPKRARGAQPGNGNALRHGARTAAAIARGRELSALLADAKKAVRCAKPFIRKRKKRLPLPISANE